MTRLYGIYIVVCTTATVKKYFISIHVFVCVCVCVYFCVCVIIMVYNVYNNNILWIKRAGGWRSRAYNQCHIL